MLGFYVEPSLLEGVYAGRGNGRSQMNIKYANSHFFNVGPATCSLPGGALPVLVHNKALLCLFDTLQTLSNYSRVFQSGPLYFGIQFVYFIFNQQNNAPSNIIQW